MKRSWIAGGWLAALIASALLPIWTLSDRIARNPLGQYVDAEGNWTGHVYAMFFSWWLPIAVAVSLLALACMYLNRPAD